MTTTTRTPLLTSITVVKNTVMNKPPLLTILDIRQGRYSNLAGQKLVTVLCRLMVHDSEFLHDNPSCAKYWAPSWSVRQLEEGSHPSCGHEWYVAAEDGTLSVYEFNHDSAD